VLKNYVRGPGAPSRSTSTVLNMTADHLRIETPQAVIGTNAAT
jgi:hypothetical protein